MPRILPLVALLLCSVANAQIDVEPRYDPYRPIVVACTVPVPDGWELTVRWRVRSPQAATSDWLTVGTSAHVWASPGQHTVEMRGRLLQRATITDQDGVEHRVIIGIEDIDDERRFTVGGTPRPPPDPDDPDDPDPDPDPDEPIPEGTYGLIRRSYEWAMLVPVNHRTLHIDAFIRNFDEASKSTKNPDHMLEDLKQANLKVTPDPSAERTSWLRFFGPWSEYLKSMYEDGRLADLTSAHRKVFEETRQGLERAAEASR